MNISVDVEYSFEDFLALNELSTRTTFFSNMRRIVLRPFGIIFGAFLAIISYGLYGESGSPMWLFYVVIGSLVCLYYLFSTKINAWATKRTIQNRTVAANYVFHENNFTQTSTQGTTTRGYEVIANVYEYKDRFFIYFDRRYALIFPKRVFAYGDAERFQSHLEAKMGKPFIKKR